MNSTLWFCVSLAFSVVEVSSTVSGDKTGTDILVVLLSQRDSFHRQQAAAFDAHFTAQVKELASLGYGSKVRLLQAHKDFENTPSPWRLFPVIETLYQDFESSVPRWLFICEENTRVNVSMLINLVDSLDHTRDVFMGHSIYDQQTISSVVRNYAIVGMPDKFSYPDSGSGILLSEVLIQKVHRRLKTEGYTEFSMDASLEFAAFVWNRGLGVPLEHSDKMCGLLDGLDNSCMSWQFSAFPSCISPQVDHLDTRSIFVAVKTCGIFHESRKLKSSYQVERSPGKPSYLLPDENSSTLNIGCQEELLSTGKNYVAVHFGMAGYFPIVTSTWGSEAQFIEYYSDLTLETLPSVNLGVGNTYRGHCAKTMAIIQHITKSPSWFKKPWVLIADDDTIIYLERLMSLLSCFNSTETLVIGERYSYGTPRRGYEFPVGGPGMVFSQPAIRLLAANCKCYANDASDDLVIGMCLKAMGITMTHSKLFHQARPKDYSPVWLANQKPISFHKHVDVDPIQVYRDLKSWGSKSGDNDDLKLLSREEKEKDEL